ncbi:MAG: DUF3971 domain-containing protein [Pseudomonadota bacterium]
MMINNGAHKPKGRQDPKALHDLPSAKAIDPIIVHTPRPHGWAYVCSHAFAFVSLFVVLIGLAGFLVLQSGLFNGPLTNQARKLLQTAVGEQYSASIGSTRVQFARRGLIALEARDVGLEAPEDGGELLHAERIRIALKMLPLLSGQLEIAHIEIRGGLIDAGRLQRAMAAVSPTADRKPFEISDLGDLTDRTLALMEGLGSMLNQRGTQWIFVTDTTITGFGSSDAPGRTPLAMNVQSAEIAERNEDGLTVAANISYAGQDIRLSAEAVRDESLAGRTRLTAQITGLHSGKMIWALSQNPRRKFRMESGVDIDINAVASDDTQSTELAAQIRISPGELFMDGVAAQIEPSTINLAFDPQKKSVEFLRSRLMIGDSAYTFRGGIIDLNNLPADTHPDAQVQQGVAVDLIVDEAIVAPTDSSEPPVQVAMKAFARYVRSERRLDVDEFIVSGRSGTMYSSASWQFSDTSPEVGFVATIDKMDTATVKQLWPYWIAKGARRWVHGNVFGGTVTDGRISILIPSGRMAASPGALKLDGNQLQIDFDISDARFDVAGDIPPVRDSHGLLALRGNNLELKIDGGTSYFPTGRNVAVSDGFFVIDQTDAIPLMADLDISVSGDASAVAELISYQPINALEQTPWEASDFEGTVSTRLAVTFGLIESQNPPAPQWLADVQLDGVTMGPRIDGAKITDATGTMRVDPDTIKIEADAGINGMQARLNFTEPMDRGNADSAERVLRLRLTEDDRQKFAPQLNEYIEGTVYLTTRLGRDGRQEIDADLTEARLVLPWIGWSKGKGIKSNATFEIIPSEAANQVASADAETVADDDAGLGMPSVFSVAGFSLTGEGFSAQGNVDFVYGEVTQATFQRVSLARNDSFAIDLEKNGQTYVVNVAGRALDMRSTIKHLMGESDVSSGSNEASKIELKVRADEAFGFNGETVSDLRIDYAGQGETILGLEMTGTLSGGGTLKAVGTYGGSGLVLSAVSNDAGDVARLTDLYPKIEGGNLDIQLVKAGDGPYIGTVEINDFNVVNDDNLRRLVSASPNGGESLNQAVRRDIDVSRAGFEQAYVRIDKGQGYLRVSDGIARGTDIGLAYQGTVFDENSGMNITGTFMPAYGLNRIFGEIPIIGAILGNGRDRGLIGITFRLTGDLEDPRLEINPISLIAPGIFRSIFQFRNDAPLPSTAPRNRVTPAQSR